MLTEMTQEGAIMIAKKKMRNPRSEPGILLYKSEVDTGHKHVEYFCTKNRPFIFYSIYYGPDTRHADVPLDMRWGRDEPESIRELYSGNLEKYSMLEEFGWMHERKLLPASTIIELKNLKLWGLIENPNSQVGGNFILDRVSEDYVRINFRLDSKMCMVGNQILYRHTEGDVFVWYLFNSDAKEIHQSVSKKEVIRLLKKEFDGSRELLDAMIKQLGEVEG
jgi:hypothetical protein